MGKKNATWCSIDMNPLWIPTALQPARIFANAPTNEFIQLIRFFFACSVQNLQISKKHTVDGWNPTPVEVGSLSHYL